MFIKSTILFIAILLSGCVSTQNSISKTTIKNQSSYESKSGYFYAILEKHANKYIVISIQDEPYEKLKKSNQEILKLSSDYKNIDLYFTDPIKPEKANTYECKPKENLGKYNQCTSDFSLSHMNTTSRYIDYKLLDSVIKDTKVVEIVEQYRLIGEHQVAFMDLKTIEDCNNFIKKYSSIPSSVSLVPKAIEKKDELMKLNSKPIDIEEQKEIVLDRDDASYKRTNMTAKKEQDSISSMQNKLKAFRISVQKGTKTNCGEVLELNNSKAKINKDNKDYWIETNKLFPQGYGCVFARGSYIAPPSF